MKIKYNGKDIAVIYNIDCVVVGGGTAGAVAAISAAREGVSTLVVEKSIALGGTQTNSLVNPMMPTYVKNCEINTIINERLNTYGIRTNDNQTTCSWFNSEKLAFVLQELLIENNGDILFDADLVDVLMENNNITHIIVNTCEGLVAIKGKNFVDSTSDALLSRLSKVEVSSGNEDGDNQMMSFRFEMANIDINKLRTYMKENNDTFCNIEDKDFYEVAMVRNKGFVLEPLFVKGYQDGYLKEEDLRYFQAFTLPGKPSCMSFNCPHIPGMNKTTSSIIRSKAVIKGREMIHRLVNFLVNYVPGFENAYLLREANYLGIRESYRIKGKYILSEEDYLKRARFEDAIAKGDWYIDVHSVNNDHEFEARYEKGEYYEIPYRSLVTNEVENLIVASRCISTTFLMQASIRIQSTMRDIAEVAGEACAYSIKNNAKLNEIDTKVLKITALA
ncbi:FAD-dependent oxidoreductase [Clostridium sp.]|uniref:FAD-dependent oxidoreductase n=1 Tax=Clostridium sp. TaxID=1506 RepID=UPI003F419176